MNRDHLRVVADNGRRPSEPCSVTRLETITFAKVEGGLVIMHNDSIITPLAAMDVLLQLGAMAAIALDALTPAASQLRDQRRVLPGDMGGPGIESDALFPENRHERGYPVDRPRPICAETEGDMA